MSNASVTPWSSNPNAPQIPYSLYFAEKSSFAGAIIGGIFYGKSICLSVNPKLCSLHCLI
jgi:hypothetical protein